MPRRPPPPGHHHTQRQQFGDELRHWRETRGLTVAQLAERVGRDRRTISGAESARDLPSEEVVHRLEKILDTGGLLLARYDAVWAEKRQQRFARNTVTAVAVPDADPSDASQFVDETVADGTLMHPGQRFLKSWTIRNSGSVTWGGRFLTRVGVCAGTGVITTPHRVPIPTTTPQQTVTIEVPCVAHFVEGNSSATFKMTDDAGRLWFPGRYPVGLQVQVIVIRPGTAEATQRDR